MAIRHIYQIPVHETNGSRGNILSTHLAAAFLFQEKILADFLLLLMHPTKHKMCDHFSVIKKQNKKPFAGGDR